MSYYTRYKTFATLYSFIKELSFTFKTEVVNMQLGRDTNIIFNDKYTIG